MIGRFWWSRQKKKMKRRGNGYRWAL